MKAMANNECSEQNEQASPAQKNAATGEPGSGALKGLLCRVMNQ